jgi:hypothetical protein
MGLPASIFDEPLTAEMVGAADALNGRIRAAMVEVGDACREIAQERGVPLVRLLDVCGQFFVGDGVGMLGALFGVPERCQYRTVAWVREHLRDCARVRLYHETLAGQGGA